MFTNGYTMSDLSPRQRILQLIQHNPYLSQQELAEQTGLSRSAVAGHIASLTRERRILGRAYVLPEQRPVVCIGGANIDRKVRTLGPLQMGTSNPVEVEETFGGVGRNVAENLARLGAPTHLITAVGQDPAGEALLSHLHALGVDTRGSLQQAHASSGTYTAVLDDQGEMVLALAHMQLCDALTPTLLQQCSAQRAAAALTVLDLNLPADSVASLLHAAREDAVPLVVVAVSIPKMARLPADLRGIRLLILNRGELESRVGRPLPDLAALEAACRQVQQQGVQDLIVTLGADGVVHTHDQGLVHLPAPQVPVRDVTGAGDAFSAAVCWSLHQQPDDLTLACRRGLTLSALTVQCNSTVYPDLTPASLMDLLA